MNAKSNWNIPVQTASGHYAVHIGEGFLESTGELISTKTKLHGTCAIITDSKVEPLYAGTVRSSLEQAGFRPILQTIPSGERSKSLEVAESCADAMISGGLDRSSFVVALGGGVVGDLTGFVAGIYFRGIPFVQIPTTVVALVDSSVGGKTGVNAKGGKNLLGVFHQPTLVIADPNTLASLPEREFREGFAEIVKHAVIRDASMLDRITPGRRENLGPLIAENVAIKAAIVEADEREQTGERALLNFGHTIGHAIENAAGYGEWFHGEAVSLGMVAALRISRLFARLPQAEEERVVRLLARLGLPVDFRKAPPTGDLLQAMRSDKKFSEGAIRFVVTQKLGTAQLTSEVDALKIAEALESLR